MGKKNLNPDGLLNELKGGSAFFPSRPPEPNRKEEVSLPSSKEPAPIPTVSINESKQASNLASKHASVLALSSDTLELIRKIVKHPGKQDVLYVRLTQEEKASLGDVTYTHKRLFLIMQKCTTLPQTITEFVPTSQKSVNRNR